MHEGNIEMEILPSIWKCNFLNVALNVLLSRATQFNAFVIKRI